MKRPWIVLLSGLLLVAACNRGGTNVVLPSLNRSARIQLFCANLEQPTSFDVGFRGLLPLDACELDLEDLAEDFTPNGLGAVTQVQSGEVAAVNFSSQRVFDTNTSVPGFTAFQVGEQPTGLQISPLNPDYTFVSSFSAKTIQAYPTELIFLLASEQSDDLPDPQERSLEAGPLDLALYEVGLPSEIVRDDEGMVENVVAGEVLFRFLYAPIPDQSAVAQIEVDPNTGELGEVTLLTGFGTGTPIGQLETRDCADIGDVPPPPASTAQDYHRICPDTGAPANIRDVKTVETTTPCTDGDGTGPRPVRLLVDYGQAQSTNTSDDVLLVADANQPIIHRFSLDATGATAIEPIDALTPTREITVTPFVPASFDNEDATRRYLYAITAPDRSVLAIDFTPDDPAFGAVLPVIAGVSARANEENVESRNRVRSEFANARTIEVVSPEYVLTTDAQGNLIVDPDTLCDPEVDDDQALALNAFNMRGVFLAVSLSNGLIFFLDIYDLNAPCRGGGCDNITDADAFASIRRHRRRWSVTPSTFINTQGTPSLLFNAAQGTLDPDNGEARNSDGPGLDFIECPESLFGIFGTPQSADEEALICTSSQVWSNFSQRWDATWGGLIPGSLGGLGRFSDASFSGEPGNWFLAGDVPFCEVGVLGPTTLPGADPDTGLVETDYGGDRLLITGELPPNRVNDPSCEQFEDVPEEIDDFPVWFPILRAFNDELEIGASPNPQRYSLDEVAFCFNQFTEYQVHTQDAYTVFGTESQFVHRTIPDPITNECILDASRPISQTGGVVDVDTVLSGRAFPGVQFINPFVSFEIQPFGDVPVTDSTLALLTFNVFNEFGVLLLDSSGGLSSLPSSMLFYEGLEQLFFVDLQRGVRQIIFDPLSTAQTFQ